MDSDRKNDDDAQSGIFIDEAMLRTSMTMMEMWAAST